MKRHITHPSFLGIVLRSFFLFFQVIADKIIWEAVRESKVVREGASEEDPVIRNVDEGGNGEFTVCWDPLDGSSIVDNNWAVGTMMGSKWNKNNDALFCVPVLECDGFVLSV